MARKVMLRERGSEWCEIQIETGLDNRGHLSICGSYGEITTRKQAKKDALEYWRSFFEDSPEEIRDMNGRQGTHFRSPLSAARYVLSVDGELHGLDVHREDEDRIYISHGGGQITDELRAWFPEIVPVLRWHLFDVTAGPMHYEANAIYWAGIACGRAERSSYDRADPVECFKRTVIWGALADDTGEPWTLAPTAPVEVTDAWGGTSTAERAPGPLHAWLRERLPRLIAQFRSDVEACELTRGMIAGARP